MFARLSRTVSAKGVRCPPARVVVRVPRRTMSATSTSHASAKSSDTPWMIGSLVVFGPALLYLLSPSARKNTHGVHHDAHDFPALKKHEEPQTLNTDSSAAIPVEIMRDDEGTEANVASSIALSEESDAPNDSTSPELEAETLAATKTEGVSASEEPDITTQEVQSEGTLEEKASSETFQEKSEGGPTESLSKAQESAQLQSIKTEIERMSLDMGLFPSNRFLLSDLFIKLQRRLELGQMNFNQFEINQKALNMNIDIELDAEPNRFKQDLNAGPPTLISGMPPRDDPDYDEQKNHERKKRTPRRLFSFDSVKSTNSSHRSLSEQEAANGNFRSPLNPFELSNAQDGNNETNLISADHPEQVVEELTSYVSPPSSPPADRNRSSVRLEPVRPTSISSTSSTTDNPPSAPSAPLNTTRARWENLRQHVLPSRSLQKQTTIQASVLRPPSRSSTPKPSGLARLGFRQVVEQARDVNDNTRKFGKEILRACSAARYAEVPRSTRDGQLSTTSLSGTVSSVSTATTARKMDYFPQYIASSRLTSPLVSASSGSTISPSLKSLYQVLIYHSRPSAETGQRISLDLPHESQVLGTLLYPFLTPSKYPIIKEEEEKATAVEAFELILRVWPHIDESASVERCLWCTKAAATIGPSATRTRILSSLWLLLIPGDENKILLTTHNFKTVTSGLLILLATVASKHTSQILQPDVQLLKDLILQFLSGSFGDLEEDHMEEVYGIEYMIDDRRHTGALRRGVFLEGLVGCIENCLGTGTGMWLLENLLEEYWSLPSTDRLTPLQAIICGRKLSTCCRFSLTLLQPFSPSPSISPNSSLMSSPSVPSLPSSLSSSSLSPSPYPATNPNLPLLIVTLMQKHVIPEAEALILTGRTDDNNTIVGAGVIRVVLSVLCLGSDSSEPTHKDDVFSRTAVHERADTKPLVKWAVESLCQWYNDLLWRTLLEKILVQVIKDGWDNAIRILGALFKFLPEEVRKLVFASILPILNDQLVDDPPAYPFPPLTSLLTDLSRIYPLVFFKPLIACATSDEEFTVVNHLCTLQIHAKYVKDYWMREVGMMCVALLKNPGEVWGVARLGQLVLLVELIGKVQKARGTKEAAVNVLDTTFIEAVKFVTTLERRLSNLIEEKEKTVLIPTSQRMLFCILFREIRLLTRSLKPAPWLSRTLSWFHEFWTNDRTDELEQEVTDIIQRIQGLYAAAQEGVQQNKQRRNSITTPTRTSLVNPNGDESKCLDLSSVFVEHQKLIQSLSKGYAPKAMKLFVSMSAIITPDDCQHLGPLLWECCLEPNVGSSLTASACFLLMQCAEKAPMELLAAIEVDLQTSDDVTRLEAVRKVSILINWRFQIVSQNILTDRTHRPFKLARAPLPFIATDLGTNLHVHVDEPHENREGDDVPLELRKRLAELGWVEEGAGVVDQRQMWIKTPLSLLSASQLDRLAGGSGEYGAHSPSPSPSPQPSPKKWVDSSQQMQQQAEEAAALLRRTSSSGGPLNVIKRRAVFVPSLTPIFRRLATLVYDSNFAVSSAARMTLLDLMRNDPAILTRPAFDLFVGEHKDIQAAVSTFAAFLHTRRVLPPPLTHHIFNNLAGFLKTAARDNISNAFHDFGQTVRILTIIATQVSDLSIREIKRSKIESLMIPSGSLWYSSLAPKGSMFPRNLGTSDNPFEPALPFESVLQNLISITMVRVSQNMFFLSMLKRNYQDVQVIRKTMSRLVLPSLEADEMQKALEIQDFMPRRHIPSDRPSSRNNMVDNLSLMVARSYILLVAQIFRSMSRHLNDRDELAVLVDGLNRTLLVHGDDINIVGQVLIALMVASTRFQRLFTSGGGYTLFMPTLVKLYVEAPSHPGIRTAIEYATSRFYALHKESFLFQSMDAIGQIALLPDIDPDWFSEGIYNMFFSLRKGNTGLTVDVAGIRNVNKAQERQAFIIRTADQTPQTFLEAVRRVDSQTGHQIPLQLPDEYETTRLNMDDFVRLFLTVIAHEPTIARARHFLRLLRFLVPHLYNCSISTRSVLADGIPALGQILTKTFAKPRGGDSGLRGARREDDRSFLHSKPGLEGSSTEKARLPNDAKQMRLDYLHFILAFGAAGGFISPLVARQTLDVLKGLLKDWSEDSFDTLSTFMSSFVQILLAREDRKFVVTFLHDFSPILHAYMITVDFTGVLETIFKLSEMSVYANDTTFSRVVVSEICTAGLAASETAASENQLMNMRYRPTLILLLGEAIFFRGTDIIGELEKHAPTYQFLAGVILPLVLTMKTGSQLITDGLRTDEHRKVLVSAWVRLLYYAMSACQKSRKDNERSRLGSFRSKSSSQERSDGAFWRSHLPAFMTALQVIKVIVIRGSDDISVPRLGIWDRLASFLRTMLAEGNAEFAVWSENRSATTTPTGSPRSSSQFDLSNSGSNSFLSTTDLPLPTSPSAQLKCPPSLSPPRMIDYSLWSMLEFTFSYRSPLRLQLKLLTMEKLVALDLELQSQESKNASSPFPPSPISGRISVFSKPRKHVSGLIIPSPESSPRLTPSSSNLSSPSMLEIPTARRAGYQMSPNTLHERPPGLPKIVHLGPASLSPFWPMPSPLIGAGMVEGLGRYNNINDMEAKTTRIKSPVLIRATLERIRGVQVFMGYSLLLPLPAMSRDDVSKDEDVTLQAWTKQQALAAVQKETAVLLEEFEESFGFDEASVLVEAEQSVEMGSGNESL